MEEGLNCNNQIAKLDSNEREDWIRGKTNNFKFHKPQFSNKIITGAHYSNSIKIQIIDSSFLLSTAIITELVII